MNQHHSNNFLVSIIYWCVGQINFIISTMTVLPFMDVLFKILSIISVSMVIVINAKKFIIAIKGVLRQIRKWFRK